MKKIKFLLLIMLATFMSLTSVNAEVLYCDYTSKYTDYFERFGQDFVVGELNDLLKLYQTNYADSYPFYQIDVNILNASDTVSVLTFELFVFDSNVEVYWSTTQVMNSSNIVKFRSDSSILSEKKYYMIGDNDILTFVEDLNYSANYVNYLTYYHDTSSSIYSNCHLNVPFYASVIPLFIMPDDSNITQVNLQTEPGSDIYEAYSSNSNTYTYKPYSTFLGLDPSTANYTEVNLDSYEYVILSLKSYSREDSFSSNLKVKGMVGITPVYEFGTVEKEIITDRCNISYSDYTDYRLYILENDLINNAVYYVKSCEEGSSFKFDSTLFDITYVTELNSDDPIITVNGTDYHTIPFSDLTNSANQNEENNFIPGESSNSSSSISTVIDSITDYVGSFWNSLTTFMSLVTKFFNVLPVEIRAICIVTFSVACTLGLLKILKS